MTALDIFALVVLAAIASALCYLLYFLGGWPGRIARNRNHTQAAAVDVCGWLGLVTGVSWVVAMVWAFWQDPVRSAAPTFSGDDEVAERILALEVRLKTLTGELAALRGEQS